jgi:uncharacterized protein YegJ (DUF2314 family)
MAIFRLLLFVLLFPFIWVLSRFLRRKDMVYLPDDHEEMKQAIAQARATLDSFRAVLASPPPNTHGFALKARFPVEGGHEHCWVGSLEMKGRNFIGKLDNQPQNLPTLRLGSIVDVEDEMVTDWAYFENKIAHGHHTTRALLPHMSKKMRRSIETVMGWTKP